MGTSTVGDVQDKSSILGAGIAPDPRCVKRRQMKGLCKQLYFGSDVSDQQDVDAGSNDSVELDTTPPSIEMSDEANRMTYDDFLYGQIERISLKRAYLESSNSPESNDTSCLNFRTPNIDVDSNNWAWNTCDVQSIKFDETDTSSQDEENVITYEDVERMSFERADLESSDSRKYDDIFCVYMETSNTKVDNGLKLNMDGVRNRKFKHTRSHYLAMDELRTKFRRMKFEESKRFHDGDEGDGTDEEFFDCDSPNGSIVQITDDVQVVKFEDTPKVRRFNLGLLEDVRCVPYILSALQFLVTDRFQLFGALYALLGLYMALYNDEKNQPIEDTSEWSFEEEIERNEEHVENKESGNAAEVCIDDEEKKEETEKFEVAATSTSPPKKEETKVKKILNNTETCSEWYNGIMREFKKPSGDLFRRKENDRNHLKIRMRF